MWNKTDSTNIGQIIISIEKFNKDGLSQSHFTTVRYNNFTFGLPTLPSFRFNFADNVHPRENFAKHNMAAIQPLTENKRLDVSSLNPKGPQKHSLKLKKRHAENID